MELFGKHVRVFRLFFPQEGRSFVGKRWLKIALRTLHLIGISGMGGAYLYNASPDLCAPYLHLSILSGFLLLSLEIWSNGIWLMQLRGMAVIVKLILLFLLKYYYSWNVILFVAVMVISGVISHAPGKIRYFSILHGKVVYAFE